MPCCPSVIAGPARMGDPIPGLQEGEAPLGCRRPLHMFDPDSRWIAGTMAQHRPAQAAFTSFHTAASVAFQLKDLIKESVREAEAGGDMISYSPRTTSLSVARAQTQRDAAEERFFKALDGEVRTRGAVRAGFCVLLGLETVLDRSTRYFLCTQRYDVCIEGATHSWHEIPMTCTGPQPGLVHVHAVRGRTQKCNKARFWLVLSAARTLARARAQPAGGDCPLAQVKKVGDFTEERVKGLDASLDRLDAKVKADRGSNQRDALEQVRPLPALA